MQLNIYSLVGYPIEAADGEIGKIEDFYFDENWMIHFLVLKTGKRLSDRKIFISSDTLLKNSRKPGIFQVNLTKEQILKCPDFSINKQFENGQHLHSTNQLSGYYIHATDGDVGYVKDFIIDYQTWKIFFLIIDIHTRRSGKKVLIATWHIKEVQWFNFRIFVDTNIAFVKNCSVFDKSMFTHKEYEEPLIYLDPIFRQNQYELF